MSLIGADGDIATRITRFANYLRNLLPSSDVIVMEMAAKAMGRLALAGGTFTPEYVEFEVRRALEYLGGDRQEGKRHAAVSKSLNYSTFWSASFICHAKSDEQSFLLKLDLVFLAIKVA